MIDAHLRNRLIDVTEDDTMATVCRCMMYEAFSKVWDALVSDVRVATTGVGLASCSAAVDEIMSRTVPIQLAGPSRSLVAHVAHEAVSERDLGIIADQTRWDVGRVVVPAADSMYTATIHATSKAALHGTP